MNKAPRVLPYHKSRQRSRTAGTSVTENRDTRSAEIRGLRSSPLNEDDRAGPRSRTPTANHEQALPGGERAHVRTAPATVGENGSGAVHGVPARPVLEPKSHQHVRRASIDVARTVCKTVCRGATQVRRTIVREHPVRCIGGHAVSIIGRYQRVIPEAVLAVLETHKHRGVDMAEPGVNQERKIELGEAPAELHEIRSNWDGFEVGLEEGVSAEPPPPGHRSLDGADVIRIHRRSGGVPEHERHEITGTLETTDEGQKRGKGVIHVGLSERRGSATVAPASAGRIADTVKQKTADTSTVFC